MNEKKLYKLFLALIVSLSLGSNPIAQNEIRKIQKDNLFDNRNEQKAGE